MLDLVIPADDIIPILGVIIPSLGRRPESAAAAAAVIHGLADGPIEDLAPPGKE